VSTDPGFFTVARAQRAHRAFTDDPVPDELIGRVLEAATYAPSAENRQPWEFVVVREPALRARIGALMQQAWEQHGRAHSEGRLAPELFADVDRGATGSISAAPVLVVVAADTARCLPATVPSSIFPALQNLLLAAGAVGLGSALTTIATAFAVELREAVGLPESVVPVAVVPLGVPAKPLGPSRREPFARHTHRDRYGTPWGERVPDTDAP
jgi:nitroreductase